MSDVVVRCEGDFEFSTAIVWDALTDADLVSGWWAEAVIVPRVGGEYTLTHAAARGILETRGRITAIRQFEILEIAFDDGSTVSIELEELPTGLRGTSTRLRVELGGILAGEAAERRADVLTSLDQLGDLLRGHPVDWSTWSSVRGPSWSRYRADIGDSSA